MSNSALSRRISEVYGVALFALALFWLIALVSYSPADPVWFFNNIAAGPPLNFGGRVGAFVAESSLQLLGYTSYLIPAVLCVIGWHAFWCQEFDAKYTKLTGAVMLFLCASGLLGVAFGVFDPAASGSSFPGGGIVGGAIAGVLKEYLNTTGAVLVLLTSLGLALVLSTQFSFGRASTHTASVVRSSTGGWVGRWRAWRAERVRARERAEIVKKHTAKAGAVKAEIATKAAGAAATLKAARQAIKPSKSVDDDDREDEEEEDEELVPVRAKAAPPSIRRSVPMPVNLPLTDADTSSKAPAERKKGTYAFPPLSLLDPPKQHGKIDERLLMDAAKLLEEKCREFSVEGSVVQIHPGPVVTTYEFKPDAGVKYSRITGLADDLCLAMQAESVLIDRIPGKSTVGIQIPNQVREAIGLRELLESDVYTRATSKLTMTLGKTINGEPFAGDMATMPHLLIAGSTGAGKSVSVNAMISSILFRASPEECRFIMIDPKRLELGMYEDIPHLMTPVVVEPKQAANALRWAVREMEERYKTLAAAGVRNIDQHNRNIRAMLEENKEAKTDAGVELKTLPYIIVIIDELADLMMVAGKEVEESICRLAQMARAIGIHLILATQRPSVDVITGVIKANLPARIAFRVASRIDSRTILDGNGAEQLLGKGDMLFLPPASSRYIRIHGPYISEQETARLCSFLRKQGKPQYDTTITAEEKKEGTGPGGVPMDKDELFDEAARIVVSSGQASISYLQRRLRIGFSRAARLIDMMEMDGIVSPATNGKREVLVDQGYFEEVDAQLR